MIEEEFSQWEDARRRIDLLALDRSGRLVVIEIKRTGSGGHMDLQAVRYAAMISSMTLDDVVSAYAAFSMRRGAEDDFDPRAAILEFMEARDEDEEPSIATDVRITLVSADFGREVTTTVLWLNGFEGMDIRCIRLVPYQVEGRILLDIHQVIPLADAADYQVKLRRKEAELKRAN